MPASFRAFGFFRSPGETGRIAARVRNTLTRQRPVLDAPARLLIEKEVVDRQALVQLIARSGHAEADAQSA
jgi:hypothetical protein